MRIDAPTSTKQRARTLRRELSLPEVLLWRALRLRPDNLKFRRQHPVGAYIADFYCHDSRLVVEIDGEAHDRGDRPARDEVRDRWFAEQGIATLRIPARDVLHDLDAVVRHIVATALIPPPRGEVAARSADGGGLATGTALVSRPPPSASPLPPPEGEDR